MIKEVTGPPFKTKKEMEDYIAHVKRVLDPSNWSGVLQSEPARKTMGDFMLAALTGIMSRDKLQWRDLAKKDSYLKDLTRSVLATAEEAFELYEKEAPNA